MDRRMPCFALLCSVPVSVSLSSPPRWMDGGVLRTHICLVCLFRASRREEIYFTDFKKKKMDGNMACFDPLRKASKWWRFESSTIIPYRRAVLLAPAWGGPEVIERKQKKKNITLSEWTLEFIQKSRWRKVFPSTAKKFEDFPLNSPRHSSRQWNYLPISGAKVPVNPLITAVIEDKFECFIWNIRSSSSLSLQSYR